MVAEKTPPAISNFGPKPDLIGLPMDSKGFASTSLAKKG
jgi:hypothetical protein